MDEDELIREVGVSAEDLSLTHAPSDDEMSRLDPIYISYFRPWNSVDNYEFAKKHGFHDLTHEWKRTHPIKDFDQVDSRAYLLHPWLKYPKFGHAAATDYALRFVRYGILTWDKAIELVKEDDSALDPMAVRDFCEFCGYTESEFWEIVDKFYNQDIFEKTSDGNR